MFNKSAQGHPMGKITRKRRKRAPTLTPARIEGIADIIRTWRGRLTWRRLCEEIERQSHASYTRQALDRHLQIKTAYNLRRGSGASPDQTENPSRSEERLQKLRLQVKELEKIQQNLLERFARWSVNAAQRGLDEDYLDRPLQRIDRAGNG